MNVSKILLLAVMVAATGLIILPNTVSIFAGQHYWYDLSGTGNNVPCIKCHGDIYEELDLSSFHKNWGTPGKADDADCEACHRGNFSIQYASVPGNNQGYLNSSLTFTPGKEAHAASVVACMLCHQWDAYNATVNVSNPSYKGYPAGGFNVTIFEKYGIYSPYNYGKNNGTWAAHNAFIAEAIRNKTLVDSNEACIACHTHVAVKITWKHASALEFTIKPNNTSWYTGQRTHVWNVTTWSINTSTMWQAYVWGTANGTGSATTTNVPPSDITWPGNPASSIYTKASS